MANPRILYDSRLNDAAPAASTTAAGYDVANLTDWRPYTEWQPTALPATVTVDSGVAAAVDYWAIWGHDLATQGATIELRSSSDNFGAVDDLVDTVTPTADTPFARYVTTPDRRYWRLRITGTTMPTLGIAALGSYLEVPRGLRDPFDPRGRKSMGRFNRSVRGQPLGHVRDYQQWQQSLTFEMLTWAWIRGSLEPAWDAHLEGTPFVFHWDPAGHPAEIAYVQSDGVLDTPHHAGSYADWRVTLAGLLAGVA